MPPIRRTTRAKRGLHRSLGSTPLATGRWAEAECIDIRGYEAFNHDRGIAMAVSNLGNLYRDPKNSRRTGRRTPPLYIEALQREKAGRSWFAWVASHLHLG